jgi:hypothetical protein
VVCSCTRGVKKTLRANGSNGKPYAIETVPAWYRVFRTMTRDAIVQLDLTRDAISVNIAKR